MKILEREGRETKAGGGMGYRTTERFSPLGDHAREFFLQLVAFVFEFANRAAPYFRSIRGEFHTIKAEVCALLDTFVSDAFPSRRESAVNA